MATRCDSVIAFYRAILQFEPRVTLLVLSPADWSNHTDFPVYGMPHYTDDQTLIVASEDNAFWQSFIPPMDQLPPHLQKQIEATYTNSDQSLTMHSFFDLLALHELGHAFHGQGGLTMQRKWMGELFANLFLHTYIAEKEPNLLPALTVFPTMVVSSTKEQDLTFTTLQELESNYNLLGQKYPNNYGWYQCRWHMAAGSIYDSGGIPVFQKLWMALQTQKERLDDDSFNNLLTKSVHPCVSAVPLGWDKK